MFNCERCEKKLWTTYHKLPDGTIVCTDCYSFYLMQIIDKIIDNQAYDILNNFVEKYQGKYPPDLLQELLRLLEIKYNTTIDVVTLNGILNIIKSKIDKEHSLKKLALFEKELIKEKTKDHFCEICNTKLPGSEYEYSMANFGKPLCLTHQREKRASPYAQKLYESLKRKGVFCELETYDSNKHIDISIKDAKLYIAVNGEHHSLDPIQLHLDLIQDEESFKKGFATKHYTLKEINENFDGITTTLAEVVKQRVKKLQEDKIIVSKATNFNTATFQKKKTKKKKN